MTTDKKSLAIRLLEIMQIQPTLETMAMAEEGIDLIVGACVEAVIAEPEIIDSSSSYRQGYARCSRDNEKALQNIIKPTCQICGSTDLWDGRFCAACAETHYVG